MSESWIVDSSGVIYDARRTPLGFFDSDGKVYDHGSVDSYGWTGGKLIGMVDEDGEIYDRLYQYVGCVDVNGAIYTFSKDFIASVTPSGSVLNHSGDLMGNVDTNLHALLSEPVRKSMIKRAAAAVLLLLREIPKE